MSGSRVGSDGWDDEPEAAIRPLTRQQAQALRDRQPQVPAWWVVAAQAAVGGVVAVLAWLVSGDAAVAASSLYGAAVVVVPGALMARGMSRRSVSPTGSAVSFMLWEAVKIAVSVLMLMLAPSIVQPLSWPAMLVSLMVCMQVYLLALLWRRPAKS